MKKYFLLLICFLYFSTSGVAQNRVLVDSLKSILPSVSGKEKVKVLRDLCYYSRSINFEEAVLYGEEAISYATEMMYQVQLGGAYEDLGSVYVHTGRYETALSLYEKARAIFVKMENRKGEASVIHNIGLIHMNKGDYPASLDYLLKALEMRNSLEGVKISGTLSSIGEVYRSEKNYDKALEYYYQALEEAQRTKDLKNISTALNNIEIIYRKRGDLEKALDYRMQVIALQKEIEDDYGLSVSYNNLGELYSAQNKLEEALQYFNQSLEIKKRLNNRAGIAHTTEELALLHIKLGNFEKAISYADESMMMAKEIGNRKKQLDVYLTLSQIYQAFGKHKQALLYHINYTDLKDSIFNTTKETLISDMETKYQTVKKEAENEMLKLETEQQLATIAKKNRLVAIFIIGSLILVALAGLLLRAYQQKNKNNKLLVTQKDQLTQLNATKNRFFGIIAHDLRGPLTALQGISGLLNYNIKKGNMESLNKIAVQIEDSALKVNALLDNLLKWALSQEGAIPYQPQRLALKPLVDESLQYFKDMAAAKDIRLEVNIPQETHVYADKETVSAIFRNLINNSIKFTPNGGAVSLLAVNEQGKVKINVVDNGTGMEEEKIQKLFILDDAKSTPGTAAERGTGLGLILVNDFVRMNQGTIEIESKVNQGSVFSINLPTKYAKAG
ncbi:tetratricopeptide repeat protein [Marivirga sp. S37H4]|uniref:histidine kinase n=1 Tax=Marivirga aurantiaca TaxID=2802615 RepID=A0A934WWZ8_9BACT|nr:tetratricopeptide repeat protein [Marivirga aurantiaca]MBK6264365.1 tetratricopeptide repeat protein [Marivirga aurantiaca]